MAKTGKYEITNWKTSNGGACPYKGEITVIKTKRDEDALSMKTILEIQHPSFSFRFSFERLVNPKLRFEKIPSSPNYELRLSYLIDYWFDEKFDKEIEKHRSQQCLFKGYDEGIYPLTNPKFRYHSTRYHYTEINYQDDIELNENLVWCPFGSVWIGSTPISDNEIQVDVELRNKSDSYILIFKIITTDRAHEPGILPKDFKTMKVGFIHTEIKSGFSKFYTCEAAYPKELVI